MQLQFSDDKKGAPSAGSADNYVINSVDGQVQCVLFCQLQWASELLIYGTDSSIVVVKLTLPMTIRAARVFVTKRCTRSVSRRVYGVWHGAVKLHWPVYRSVSNLWLLGG